MYEPGVFPGLVPGPGVFPGIRHLDREFSPDWYLDREFSPDRCWTGRYIPVGTGAGSFGLKMDFNLLRDILVQCINSVSV